MEKFLHSLCSRPVWCSAYAVLVCGVAGHSMSAFAGDDALDGLTPRDRIVHFLTGQYPNMPLPPNPQVNLSAPVSQLAPTTEELRALSEVSEDREGDIPALRAYHNIESAEDPAPLSEDMAAPITEVMPMAMPVTPPVNISKPLVDVTAPVSPFLDQVSASGRRPFYLSASDYLALREGGEGTQLRVSYVRQASDATTGIKTSRDEVDIIIGSDYAAIAIGDVTKIYDFSQQRRLTLFRDEKSQTFHNTSLYPLVLRKVEMVSRTTRGGSLESVKFSPEIKLDRFWVEAAMGYAVGKTPSGLDVKVTDANLTARYDDKSAVNIEYGKAQFPSAAHAANFAALLRYDVSIHPVILDAMRDSKKLPRKLSVLSFAPKFPSGINTVWTLGETKLKTGTFPLPRTARSVAEGEDIAPLAYVVSEAAQGQALDGPMTVDTLIRKSEEVAAGGDLLLAWSYIERAIELEGACDRKFLCERQRDLKALVMADATAARIVKSLSSAKTEATRIKAVKALQPVLELGTTPAFVFRRAGEIRARINRRAAKDAELESLTAMSLLEAALIKDPYDPFVYRALAQVYAAQGRYTESWDMQDAVAVFANAPAALSQPVLKTEMKLRQQAPAFFP